MVVTVHLHTILQRETAEGLQRQLDVTMAPNSTLAELLDHLEVELAPDALLLAVNGRTADLDQVLSDGDEIHLMPAIAGG